MAIAGVSSIDSIIWEAKEMYAQGKYINGTVFHGLVEEIERLRRLSPSPDASAMRKALEDAFNRGAREGWLRCGVYHIDIDFEGRPETQAELDRWPLSQQPESNGR